MECGSRWLARPLQRLRGPDLARVVGDADRLVLLLCFLDGIRNGVEFTVSAPTCILFLCWQSDPKGFLGSVAAN